MEMAGLVETVESQRQASHEFPQLRRAAEKWKTRSRFPTFPPTVVGCLEESFAAAAGLSPASSAANKRRSED